MSDADFVERRRHRIGASDVAAALTGSFGRSPAAVIAGKLGLISDEPTERMRLGLALEDTVIDAAAALLRFTVVDRQVEVTHSTLPFLTATCDALVLPGESTVPSYPLEVKTTSAPGGYPSEYLEAQLAVQCACCGVGKGFSAIRNLVTGDLTVAEHRFTVNELDSVEDLAESLWSYLERGELPPAMFPADSGLWNRLHPQSTDGSVELDPELVENYVVVAGEAKQLTSRVDVLEARIKEALGDCELGTVAGVERVRWRTVTSRRVDLKSLETAAPELVEAHRKESTARRFTLVSPIHPSSRKAIPS